MRSEQEYLIRPAPVRGQLRYALTNDRLECRGKDGWSLALRDLQAANFVQHRVGDQVMWRLDLDDGTAQRRVATSFSHAARADSDDCAAFVDLCTALSLAVAEIDPDFRVGYGEYGKARLVFFAIGLASTLFGITILVAALLTGVSGDRLMGGGIAIAVLVIFGLVLARGYSPWRKPIPVDIARFPAVLSYLAGRSPR